MIQVGNVAGIQQQPHYVIYNRHYNTYLTNTNIAQLKALRFCLTATVCEPHNNDQLQRRGIDVKMYSPGGAKTSRFMTPLPIINIGS